MCLTLSGSQQVHDLCASILGDHILDVSGLSHELSLGVISEIGNFHAVVIDADTQAILTEAAKAFGEEEKKINRQAAADNLQSCIDDYGMEVTYLTDDATNSALASSVR